MSLESNRLEGEGLINFGIYDRGDNGDYWLEVEYYSKIGKTIIWDSQFCFGEDVNELADILIDTQKSIDEFELSIKLQK